MKSGSSFDIRVVGGLTKEEMKEMTRETFALIRLRGSYINLAQLLFVLLFAVIAVVIVVVFEVVV